MQKLRSAFVTIRERPHRGLATHPELGRNATAKVYHKQFVDRCWSSSTTTRSAAAVDLTRAPGTDAAGPNSAWEEPFSSDTSSST